MDNGGLAIQKWQVEPAEIERRRYEPPPNGVAYLNYHTAQPQCTRAAMSAGDADAPVRWDSCRLDFFGTFLFKQKSTEEMVSCADDVKRYIFAPQKN